MQELLQLAAPVRALADTFKGKVFLAVPASIGTSERMGLVGAVDRLRDFFEGLDRLIGQIAGEVETGVEQELARLTALVEPIAPVLSEKRLRFTMEDGQPTGLSNQTRIVLALFLAQAKTVSGRVDGQ